MQVKFLKLATFLILLFFSVSSCENDDDVVADTPNQDEAPSIVWQKVYHMEGNYNYLQKILPTVDEGYMIGGHRSAYSGGPDWWGRLTKIDGSGEMIWDNIFGGTTRLTDIKQTTDNGYIVASTQTVNENWITDYRITKFDNAGNEEWNKYIGGSDWDGLISIEQTLDGGYILAGFSNSGVSEEKTEENYGESDFWIIKINAAGDIEWQKTFGGQGVDYPKIIMQTMDGGYVVSGDSDSDISGNKTETNRGLNDYWILKLNDLGNIEWQKTLGGENDDTLISAALAADGIILAGNSSSEVSGDKTEPSNGMVDLWLLKLDFNGTIVWQNTIGGSNDDVVGEISLTSDNGIIVAASSKSGVSGDKTVSSEGGYDYWFMKLDSGGNLQWQESLGGSEDDKLMSVRQASNDSYILGGYSNSLISGDKTEGPGPEESHLEHYWVMKYTHN